MRELINLTPNIPPALKMENIRNFTGIYCMVDPTHIADALSGWATSDICQFCFTCEKCNVDVRFSEHIPLEIRQNPSGFQRTFEGIAYQQISQHLLMRRNKAYERPKLVRVK